MVARPQRTHAQPYELTYDVRISAPLTAAAATWVIGSELAKPHLTTDHCRWCDRAPDGRDTLNPIDAGVRRALLWRDTGTGDLLSHVAAYGLVPLAAAGTLALAQWHEGTLHGLTVDLLIVLEASALALAASQIVKFSTARPRPFVHARDAMGRDPAAGSSDDNVSFYSGHSSAVFAVAVAAGTVACMRGYRWAHGVWIAGLALAAGTAYLRIASDRHYFSDVIVGSVVGAGLGFAVPWLLHSRRAPLQPAPTISRVPGGALLTLTWVSR
ncbi:MAG: phosphatase PAP2 family protein [Polyangiales bacterium]